jgi:hypothetical protein
LLRLGGRLGGASTLRFASVRSARFAWRQHDAAMCPFCAPRAPALHHTCGVGGGGAKGAHRAPPLNSP